MATMTGQGQESTEKSLPARSKLDLDEYIFAGKDGPKIVPESDLRALTQGPLKRLILNPENYEKSLSLWNCLFHTFEDTLLPIPHGAAACNALCAFLEAALTTGDSEICQFARSEATWLSVFGVYLERFEFSPPKPMKQILATLTNILATHPDPAITSSIRSYLTKSVVQTIILAEPLTRLKASVVSLHFLIRKDAFPAVDLMSRLQDWLRLNLNSWIPVVGAHCTNIGLDISATFAGSDTDRASIHGDELGMITAQVFCLVLLLHLQNPNVVTSSGALLAQICFKLKREFEDGRFQYSTPDKHVPFWTAPLKYLSLQNLDNLDATISLAFHLLFKGRPAEFQSFLDVLPLQDLLSEHYNDTCTPEFDLLIAVLETGKELGLVHEDQAPTTSSTDKPLVLESRKLGPLLIHSNAKIRIPVLSLLISAPSTTKPFSPDALLLFKETFPFIHAEADAHVRSELVSLIRKLTVRLRGGASPRQSATTGVNATDKSSQYHDAKAFVSWYIDFLESELRPSASYQTHILALKALATVIQSGLDPRIDQANLSKIGNDQRNWPFSIDIFTSSLFRALGDLLINPYEEIRMTSLSILGLFPRASIRPQPQADSETDMNNATVRHPYRQLLEALSRVEDMAGRTSRADHADGLARIYHLLFDLAADGRSCDKKMSSYHYKYGIVDLLLSKLEKVTSLSDIVALRNTPIHGHLSALRYITATPNFYSLISSENDSRPAWKDALERILLLCEAMWSDVQAVLCVDSPEREHGNSADDLLGPKDILSCCWRALRESSLLLNAILSNISFAPSGYEEGLSYEEFSRVGNLTFSQLAELRHRGAFSAVSQTYASCCQRCSLSKCKDIAGLPETWFKEILNTIHGQSSKLTRRSAGLPALALGVASSAKLPFFHEIMENLQGIAKVTPTSKSEQSDMRLPQVHAMNCLKDIFTATNLANVTEGYLMPALSISAECLGSEIWAIRNCGLMLFRSLVQRMCRRTNGVSHGFGLSTDPEPKQLIPFQRFPGLIPLLAGLLEKGAPNAVAPTSDRSLSWELSIITERVFPALELIGNKFPSPSSSEDQRILELIAWQFESPAWGVRDHAARTYATLIERDDILSAALELSMVDSPMLDQNIFINFERHVSSPLTLRELVEILNYLLQCGIAKGVEGQIAWTHLLRSPANPFFVPDPVIDHFDAISRVLNLDRIFDNVTSNSDPNSSTARSSSLLLESITFSYLTMGVLLGSSLEELAEFIRTVSDVDVDVIPSGLKRFHQVFVGHSYSRRDRLNLYCSIITEAPSKQAKLVAISSLSTELEEIQESTDKYPRSLDEFGFLQPWLPSFNVLEEEEEPLWDREMVDASVRLQGCLISLNIRCTPKILDSDSTFAASFKRLIRQLSFSMRDETFPATPILVDVLFVLYDMLNDDDVELREEATLIAAQVLADQSMVFRLPAAAAAGITDILANHFHGSVQSFEEGLKRFLGPSSRKHLFVSAAETLNKAIKESAVLFAEEKQNLYIDDVREIKIWAEHLIQLNNEAIDICLYNQFNLWVMDGLDALYEIATTQPKDSLLGWTSNVDVFVTGLRILYGAKVLLLTHRDISTGVNLIALREKLQCLLASTTNSELNPPWVSLLESLNS
ncbi:uncharacterized protein GIQ15_01988 [Arthroderma uncinatum]|uniref:uncharacterized protein n=1 Tax=Arthroderma uncinatum TaxID=74035 RepID=UPI00144AE8A4|nr:uncharacterized protein GIQ15_01988 [Arthroderma uncinatum]KAF3482664.1 hypothetical protein GIQ15_01988 [Arthroderma uncinatum]